MDSDTSSKRPDWLTDEAVEELKSDLVACPNPYTKEDIANIEMDALVDIARYNAYVAKDILTAYGLI